MRSNIEHLTEEQKALETDYATNVKDHKESESALAAQRKMIE